MADINTARAPMESIRAQVATHSAASQTGTRMLGRSPVTQEAVRTGGVDQSDISDAMEELGAAVANRRKPRMEETKVRKGAGAGLEAMGRIAQYQDKLPDRPSEQRFRDLKSTIDRFRDTYERGGRGGEGAARPTAEDVLAALAEYDADPTHQFAALETLRRDTAALGASPAFLATLDEARARFHEGPAARDVTAGFAVAGTAHDLAERGDADPSQIRDAYRAAVREWQHMGQIFDHLRGFDASGTLKTTLDAFLKVAGRELQAFGDEADAAVIGETKQLLGAVLSEMQKLKLIGSVGAEAREALSTLTRMYPQLGDGGAMPNGTGATPNGAGATPGASGATPGASGATPGASGATPDGTEMTSRLLHFSANATASLGDAERVVDGLADPDDPGVAVSAANAFRDVHASLPDVAMPSASAREGQARAMVDLSDRLVAAEEAWFEAQDA